MGNGFGPCEGSRDTPDRVGRRIRTSGKYRVQHQHNNFARGTPGRRSAREGTALRPKAWHDRNTE